MKKCICWCLSIIELKNARWNIEIIQNVLQLHPLVVQWVEALRYKPECHGFSFLWAHTDFSLAWSFRPHYSLGSTQPLTETSTRIIPLGQSRSVHIVDSFATFMCPLFWNSGTLDFLEPSGLVQVCIGFALPLTSSECSVSRLYVYFTCVMQTEHPEVGASGVCCHRSQGAIIRIHDKRKYKVIQNALSGEFCRFRCCPEMENTSV